MSAVLENNVGLSADDDLVSAGLVGEVQGYLAARARHVSPSPRSAEAWRRFYRICNSYIRRTVVACGTQPGDLDDCVQQVWADVLVSLPRLGYDRSRGRFRGWLATLAHSKSIDLLRRRARRPLCDLRPHFRVNGEDPNDGPDEACEHAEGHRQVRLLLLYLCRSTPPASFRVFYRRCIMEQSTNEVAAKVGLAPEQVRFRLHRVRERIREIMRGGRTARSECEGDRRAGPRVCEFPEFRATEE